MSWFDKLFGESSDKSIAEEQETPQVDDVYRRPRGKFRFPVNVDHIKTDDNPLDAYPSGDDIPQTQPQDELMSYPNEVNTEDIRTSFETDYVPRRERRRKRQSVYPENQVSHQSSRNERYQPKTRQQDINYRSYEPQVKSQKSHHRPSFTEKQYSVHQPKFKASVVPSAIYGTKPRKDPAQLKNVPVPPIKGTKPMQTRPKTPTHRKEDNTVNIENVYASQIVAEIRREREKKLQRKKQFELERAQLKMQQDEVTSIIDNQKSEHHDLEAQDSITVSEETIDRTPKINQINLTEQSNEEAPDASIETVALNEVIDREIIQLDTDESVTIKTGSKMNEEVEITSIQDAEAMMNEANMDDASDDTVELILDDNESGSIEPDTQEQFLEENVAFETLDEVEAFDDLKADASDEFQPDEDFESIESSEVHDDVEDMSKPSLEPVLFPEMKSVSIAHSDDTTSENTINEQNEQPELISENIVPNSAQESSLEQEVETVTDNKAPVQKKVSPFNVVMTPSDKRRLLDKQKQRAVMQPERKMKQVQEDQSESNDLEPISEQMQPEYPNPDQASSLKMYHNDGDAVKKEPTKRIGPKYLLPPVSLLHPEDKQERDASWVDEHKAQLDDAFYHFNVPAKVENVVVGPSVTRFELSVEKGVKVSRITNLQDDIKMALAAKDIRIEAPIPGTSLVGVEVPNVETRNVNLSEVLFSKKMKFAESKLTVALGARINNEPMIMDLAKMPHGLIAGATGSGKSVCINSILVSLLYRNNPNELKLLLIDPKMVELAPYNDLPHLIAPVITDVKAATESLKWVVEEMERRYKIFADIHVRNITAYNQKVSYVERLPKIVIVIDELADLMMMSPQDVEHAIARIAQKARAAGIHMILATQRPSVNVITGLIKANVPTRIAFMVSSAVDSRTIIDSGGAEKLLGNGDMLYLGNGMNKPIRIQGNYVSDDEIDAVVQYVKTQGEPNYLFQEKELLKKVSETPKDELFNEICDFMIEEGHISTSQIQRRFQIGYNRAARIIDQLEEMGYVSGQNGSKPRAVLITEKQAEY
ncbi:DNA translocase FtsK [Macrococcus caseolyticus]|nr:DNA translocase FtsK [Macrococcus caseolyticus]